MNRGYCTLVQKWCTHKLLFTQNPRTNEQLEQISEKIVSNFSEFDIKVNEIKYLSG